MGDWKPEDWIKLWTITAEPGRKGWQFQVPPLAGRYEFDNHSIRFFPLFPLTRGVTYKSVFRLSQDFGFNVVESSEAVVDLFPLPKRERQPSAKVEEIYPTSDVLPENLLKFYIQFTAPMSGGRIYDHIQLLDSLGQTVELPFLEIDEELWDPEMKRLTLFIDPGRIKRGVKPLEEIGPSLQEGGQYQLIIHSQWKDAEGVPLVSDFIKTFRVSAPDREPPNPVDWKLDIPPSDTRRPIKITFNEPMDHALAVRMLHVVDGLGMELEGAVELLNNQTLWVFRPESKWIKGSYKLLIETHIEDLAGNNIGKPFEVDLFGEPRKRLSVDTYRLSFHID